VLRPQDTKTRERKSLNGLWAFALDPNAEGRAGRWFADPLADTREMAVPASFNDITADPAVRDYFGDVWYQTTVRVPRGWAGQRIVLHFESATHRATVWSTTPRWSRMRVATRPSRPTSPTMSAPATRSASQSWSTTR
jgi:beta-glucuronidase